MSKSMPIPPPGFDDLSIEERLSYVQSLWDRIAAKPEKIPVPDWHLETLRNRLANYQTNPFECRSWDEILEELRRKLGESI